MDQVEVAYIYLLLGLLYPLIGFGMLLYWVGRKFRKSKQDQDIGRVVVKIRVPACDYPEIPETSGLGLLEQTVPEGIKDRQWLIAMLSSGGFDLKRTIGRSYFVDDLTGMGFYEFTQEV